MSQIPDLSHSSLSPCDSFSMHTMLITQSRDASRINSFLRSVEPGVGTCVSGGRASRLGSFAHHDSVGLRSTQEVRMVSHTGTSCKTKCKKSRTFNWEVPGLSKSPFFMSGKLKDPQSSLTLGLRDSNKE